MGFVDVKLNGIRGRIAGLNDIFGAERHATKFRFFLKK